VTAVSPWLTVDEACAYAKVSRATLLRAARLGRVQGFKVNSARLWRFRASDLDTWIEKSATPVPFAVKLRARS
jgi:excisionase family DNA binding protein